MKLFENLMNMLPENLKLDDLAQKVGLNVDDLKTAGESLFTKLKDGSVDKATAIREAAAETGIDAEKLKNLMPAMAEKLGLDGEGSLMDKLNGENGLLGKVTGMLDRDGDGNPLNDIAGMFGKK
jgi:hypothetical protein